MTKKNKQKEIFLNREGNEYFKRNKSNSYDEENDRIINAISHLNLKPHKVLEIGCSNGLRLSYIYNNYKAACYGIDPSIDAIADGELNYPKLILSQI